MSKRYKCLQIDATKRTIVQVDYGDYRDLQVLIGGLISVAWRFESGDVLFVDDEGLLKPCEHFFRIPGQPQPLAGNAVLTGPDVWDEEAEDEVSSDVNMTVEALARLVTFVTGDQARAWARGNASEPASAVTYLTDDGTIRTDVLERMGSLFGVAPKGGA
jgi:Domain of unknown function (DUF3846)